MVHNLSLKSFNGFALIVDEMHRSKCSITEAIVNIATFELYCEPQFEFSHPNEDHVRVTDIPNWAYTEAQYPGLL